MEGAGGSGFKEATEGCDCGYVWLVGPDLQPHGAVATQCWERSGLETFQGTHGMKGFKTVRPEEVT